MYLPNLARESRARNPAHRNVRLPCTLQKLAQTSIMRALRDRDIGKLALTGSERF
jgi:hypothetical protein